MKNLLAIILIAITSTILITSCVSKTPLSEENQVYAGKWVASDGTWIQIFNDGGGNLELSNTTVTGGSAVFAEGTIKIEVMGIGSTFVIDKPPYEEDGKWIMKLDGIDYVKQ